MRHDAYDVAVVGAGFTGATVARRFAELGRRVLIIEQRDQLGGNAADEYDHDILVHVYGPHIFHTNSDRVVDFLSQFTQWRPYVHRVVSEVDGRLYPFPINRTTLISLYGASALQNGVQQFLDSVRVPISRPQNAEEQVLSLVGEDLYRRFFQPYTEKQWGRPATQLAPSVTARIPVRVDDDDRYFSDRFQFMPRHGYHRLFRRLVGHRNIDLLLGVPWETAVGYVRFRRLVYTV